MTDKKKIRKEVERLRNLHQMKYQHLDTSNNMSLVECGKRNLCNELLSFIDSLQEEPVSIWHNMDKVPIKGEVIVVQTKDTFYGLSIQKGGTTYKKKNKDRYVRWAYASDLLKLSNVQRTVKDGKEPVSEELEGYINQRVKTIPVVMRSGFHQLCRTLIKDGAQWHEQQMKEVLRTEYEKGRHDALEEMKKEE